MLAEEVTARPFFPHLLWKVFKNKLNFQVIKLMKSSNTRVHLEQGAKTTVEVFQALVPLLKKSAKANAGSPMGIGKSAVISISTGVASLADNTSGRLYSYRCSKVGFGTVHKVQHVSRHAHGVGVV